jgi:hypothetical protein
MAKATEQVRTTTVIESVTLELTPREANFINFVLMNKLDWTLCPKGLPESIYDAITEGCPNLAHEDDAFRQDGDVIEERK